MSHFKKILITGSNGFIAKNLNTHLSELGFELFLYNKETDNKKLKSMIKNADFIFHLAGENRPNDNKKFKKNNVQLTKNICDLASKNNPIPICFSSSTQATMGNDYGKSKLEAEDVLKKYSKKTTQDIFIYRLPGVFGKWSRPNYNSVVSTFCHNIANGIDINIHDPSHKISIVYIDDIIKSFITLLIKGSSKQYVNIPKVYEISIGSLANKIKSFHTKRKEYFVDQVGVGLTRALYSTYLSYLPKEEFSYDNYLNKDDRGIFSEIIKTKNSGQVSFFTAKPNITRGIHYHHTKTEKFIVIQGKARLRFKNILTGEKYTINVSSKHLKTIDTIPGWAHDITNTGSDELIVILWANEIFDNNNPDTFYKQTS
jgi:UDP-2-acetamido-2,6-beta-L-arabino-hexul-4-ose reductase